MTPPGPVLTQYRADLPRHAVSGPANAVLGVWHGGCLGLSLSSGSVYRDVPVGDTPDGKGETMFARIRKSHVVLAFCAAALIVTGTGCTPEEAMKLMAGFIYK